MQETAMPLSQQPDVTVAIMSYNNAAFIGKTVESALAQTGISFEVIVFDDRSSDDSVAVLERYTADPRFRYEINPKNLGMMGNYNRCVDSGSGRYVVVLGSDDMMYAGHLSSLFAALELHPEAPLAYTRCDWIDENGSLVRQAVHPGLMPHSYFGHRDEVVDLLIHDNYITPSAVMLRRSILDKVRLPDGNVHAPDMVAGDWELWTRIARAAPDFVFLHQATLGYRIHGGQISQSFYKSDKPLAEHTRILELNLADPAARQRMRKAATPIWEHYRRRQAAYSPEVLTNYDDRAKAIEEALYSPVDNQATGEMPLFTVILTTYNRPRLLADALRSVDCQSFRDFEVIVVNDCGEPVEHLLNQFGSVVHMVRHGANRGLSAARNTGLAFARGKYVVYLDDDDLMLPHHLEVLAEQLAAHPDAVIYTDADYVSETIEAHRRIEHERNNPHKHGDFSADRLLVQNFIPVNTFCHPMAAVQTIGRFDESLPALEDWEFLLRLTKVLPFLHIHRTTVEVRMLKDSAGNHMSGRIRKNFPELFRKIYAAYPSDNPNIRAGRAQTLALLDAERQADHAAKKSEVDKSAKIEETDAERLQRHYTRWIERHSLQEIDAELMAERMVTKWSKRPHFLLILLHPSSSEAMYLFRTIQSLQRQFYQDWRLIILADAPSPDPVFEQTDTIGWLQLDSMDDDATVIAAINQVLRNLPSDWAAVLPAGVEFESNWMLTAGDYINKHPEWAAIYVDDDYLDSGGGRCSPRMKPDFNLDYLRSMDYIGASCWFRTEHLVELGGVDTFPGAIHYEYLLRLLDTCSQSVIGHIAEPLIHYPQEINLHPLAEAAAHAALQAHLLRNGTNADIEAGYLPGTRHLVYKHPTQPLVTIIVPNRDSFGYLEPCIESIFAKTDYPAFEVIVVDNQTTDPDVLTYYVKAAERFAGRFRVISYNNPFNFSAQCNIGVEAAKGDYILLLNNDTEVVQPAWLTRMMQFGQRPDVGIVGARLVYPEDGGIQHAGVIVGLGRLAAHPYQGRKLDEAGYMNRLQVDQNLSAVTAACLLIRRSVYMEVGGMDADNLEVLFNDVDLCLKTHEAGYRIVWTPYATIVHLEHKSIEVESKQYEEQPYINRRNEKAMHYMHSRWGQILANDPAYNRHLTLHDGDFSIDPVLVADWDPNFHDRKRVLAFPPAGGVGEYRFYAPLRGLAMQARLQSTVVQTAKYHESRYLSLPELNRLNPDTLMRQTSFDPLDLAWLQFYRRHRPDILYVYMMDDLITVIPRDNPNYRIVPRDCRSRLRHLLSHVDRLIVSSQPLVEFVHEMVPELDVRLLPNRLRDDLWGHLRSQRRTSARPRIGWAGAQQHAGDLSLIVDVVKQMADEADWIFFGMCPDELRPYAKEYHEFEVGVEAYPAKLASLNLDLAVAPLEIHPFNEAKSNLRILEYGILGWPVVCTDILPYQTDNAPVKRVPNQTSAWLAAIRERINDLDATACEGDALKEWVTSKYMLSQHLDDWYHALTEPRR